MEITWSVFHTPYDSKKVNAVVPEKAGVYLLWVKLKNDKWRCFYAGQANNLKTRLLEHLSENEKNKCIKENVSNYVCGFEFSKITLQKDRDGVEKYLINHYKPECNNNKPECDPIEVNLP